MIRSAASFSAAVLLAASCLLAPAMSAQDADPLAPAAPKVEAKKASPFPVAAAANTGWALEFTHNAPHAVLIKDADGKARWWWYMTFKIENREDEPRLLIPVVQVVTDAGHIHNGNAQIPQNVYETIYKRCGNALCEPLAQIAGPMKPGKDFAHNSIVIWPQSEDDVDSFSIYVSGIYGETQPVNDPATGKPLMAPVKDPITGEVVKEADGSPMIRQVELKRTLRLDYTCPGTLIGKEDAKLNSSDDVMR